MSSKSIIYGKNSNDTLTPVPVNMDGHLCVDVPKSAFGDLRCTELTPRLQTQFSYLINSNIFNTSLVGTGSASVVNRMLTLDTGATASSLAYISSRKTLKYRSGFGAVARFSAMFTTPKDGSNQFIGVGSTTDGFIIGYANTDFCIVRLDGGSDNKTIQGAFSEDTLNGLGRSGMNLTPGFLNVFEIRYQWLGAGQITFLIEDPNSGEFIPFHKIKYANSSLVPSVQHPDLPISAYVENSTNDTSLVLSCASMGIFIEGQDKITSGIHTNLYNNRASTGSTEIRLFNCRVVSNFNMLSGGPSVANTIISYVHSISCSNDNARMATFRIYRNCTIGGSPVWTDNNGLNSVMQIDTVGTIASFNGVLEYSLTVGKDSSMVIDLSNIDLFLIPGDTLTVSAVLLGGAGTSSVEANLTFKEDW